MGSKGSQSTSTVQIPQEVLQRYNAVNANAEQVAQRPFQTYSGQFVAPLNATQQAGIDATNQYSQTAQPYFRQATNALNQGTSTAGTYYNAATQGFGQAQNTGNLLAGASLGALANANASANPYNAQAGALNTASTGAVNPSDLDAAAINKYMSPYLQTVLGSTASLLNQNNQQQQAGQLGNAIRSGAFGGDRAGIAAANLAQQQNLANANIYSNIANEAYNNALGTAQQQQGLGLSAAQANRAALQQGATTAAGLGQQVYGQNAATAQELAALGQQQYGQQAGTAQNIAGLGQTIYNTGAGAAQNLAALGTGAQGAALQGAQAQLAAGLGQQQTEQAQDTALYNQFLQQQSYPFQVAQFLANIAEGTGALSGSTTTTNSVQNGIFSDKRLKHDIRKVGETFDHQPIYSFKYKGDPRTQMGLLAQEVEKKHPDAVGLAAGYKTVRYDEATDDAAKRGHFATGGLVVPDNDVRGYDIGGAVQAMGFDPNYIQSLMAAYHAMYGAPASAASGLGGINGGSIVPPSQAPQGHLAVSQAPVNPQQPSAWETAGGIAKAGDSLGQFGSKLGMWHYGSGGEGKAAPLDTSDPNGLAAAADAVDDITSDGLVDRLVRRRSGLAAGGKPGEAIPYLDNEAQGLNIPDDRNERELMTGQNPTGASGGGGSALGTLGKVAGAVGLASGLGALGGAGSAMAAGSGIGGLLSFLPFLSDKRLKENIKPVGKTFDGQTVYSYNFKGDATTQMGLLAQEVEKKHPHAVGEHNGYKTVDYAHATNKAAKRGHFADGGAAEDDPYGLGVHIFGKYDSLDDDMRDELNRGVAAQKAPEASDDADTSGDPSDSKPDDTPAGGILAGSVAAAAPAVAAAKGLNLAPKDAEGVFGKMLRIESGGKQFRKDGSTVTSNKGAIGIAQIMPGTGPMAAKLAGLPWDIDRLKNDADYNKALGKAYYGDLVKQFGGDTLKAAAAYNAGAGRVRKAVAKAGSDWLGQMPAETQDYVAKIGGVKRATGGRTGYADGGDPTLENAFDADAELKKRAEALAAAQAVAAPATTDNSMATGAMPTATSAAPENLVPAGLGATTPVPAGKGVVAAAEEPAAALPAVAPQAGLAAASAPAADDEPTAAPAKRHGVLDTVTHGGFMRGLGHGDANSWIPFLSGLAAFGTANTNNPLTALVTGLGAGAQAAQGQREFGLKQQEIANRTAQTEANVGQTRAATIGMLQDAYKKSVGNSAAQADFIVYLRNALKNGLIDQSDIPHITAPQTMPSVEQVTPHLGGTYIAPAASMVGNQQAAGATAAPVASAPAAGSVGEAYPSLAGVKPMEAPKVAPTEVPYKVTQNPGDAMMHEALKNDPEFQQYQQYNDQARAIAAQIANLPAPMKGMPSLVPGLTEKMNALNDLAKQHLANAQTNVTRTQQQAVANLQKGVDEDQTFVANQYPQTTTYLKSMTDALANSVVQSNSPVFASFVGKLASLPGMSKVLPDSAKILQGSVDSAQMNQVYNTMLSLVHPGVGARTQATEASQLNNLGAGALKGPAAAYSFALKQKAILDQGYERALAHSNSAKDITNDARWTNDWMQDPDHQIQNYVYDAAAYTPLPRGVVPAQVMDLFKPVESKGEALSMAKDGAKNVRIHDTIYRIGKGPNGFTFTEWKGD